MDLLNIFAMKTYILINYSINSLHKFSTESNLIIKYIIISLCKLVEKIYYFLFSNVKSKYLLILKTFCFIILCYECLEVTTDFLHYPYVYKFDIKPSEGLDLPPITICTERDVFFDKTRIVRHFNIRREYESYKLSAKQQSIELYNKCVHYIYSMKRRLNRHICHEFKNYYYY